ncbi:MAG: ABC transporter substrate-binding protein, partial [Caulobacteraceae bacterium]
MSFSGEFRLGFLALTDAAPLIVADRLGLFAEQGLRVSLHREASWATLRDKLAAGLVDGAHMLAHVAVAARLGVGGVQADMIAPLALNVNGAGVTLSIDLLDRIGAGASPMAHALAELVAERRRDGSAPLTFGVVFSFSTHAYLLREWLVQGGIDPDRDVRL